ncbi:MAG: methylmalonyl-CoA mutase [Myxococcaceae bacterium]
MPRSSRPRTKKRSVVVSARKTRSLKPVRKVGRPKAKARAKSAKSAKRTPVFSAQALQGVARAQAKWRTQDLARATQKAKLRKEAFVTDSGIPVPELVGPLDRQFASLEDIGLPGAFPYTRGIQPTMYRGRLWTMRQFAGFGSPKDTNARFKYLLSQGVSGLSTAFDMPALMGYDADHAMSRGEVGKEGVAVSSLRDFEQLFDGIPLDKVTTSMTINASAIVALCMYIAVAEKQGVSMDRLGGTIQNDMLKEYIAQKEWIVPPGPAVRVVVDMIEFCAKHMPRWHAVSISGYHIREAGATGVQELAFTLADGIAYVAACVERGMLVDDFAPRLSFFFDVHNDFFEEIAKFRAARRIWARVMKERFGAKDPRSMQLRTHAQTAGVSLTAQQPYNNVVRTTLQALAAVLGGTQSLHTNSLDETYALPTEEAVTIALRTQQIIAHESGVDRVVDPLGGSYFIEQLTDEVEARAMAYIQRIDEMGGMLRAVEAGYPQREIADSAYQHQREVERQERIIVGINAMRTQDSTPIPTLKIDENVAHDQVASLRAVRSERDAQRVERALAAVEQAARGTANLMPPVLEAVRAYATLGEVSDVFRRVWGVYREGGAF